MAIAFFFSAGSSILVEELNCSQRSGISIPRFREMSNPALPGTVKFSSNLMNEHHIKE
jgi:hypothetical protein